MNIIFSIFSTPTGMYGSQTRMLALADKFKSEGHNVSFTVSGNTADILVDRGYKVYTMSQPTILGLPKIISDKIVAKSQRSSLPVREGKSKGSLWLLYFFVGYAKLSFLINSVKTMIEITEKESTDCIMTELDLCAYMTAFIKDIPLVTTYAKISKKDNDGFFANKILKIVRKCISEFRQGIEFDFDYIYVSKTLKLIPSIPQLDGTKESADVCYVGNMVTPVKTNGSSFKIEEDKKYIFCYFGTGSISLTTIEKHLPKALNDRDDIVCYVASQSVENEYTIGNVRFVNFIDANVIMPKSILTICHGGLNTITQSLAFGVPLMIFPGAIFERRYNASQVQKNGIGYMGELSDFNADWIKDKLCNIELLSDKVVEIQSVFRRYDGVNTAYDNILNWIDKNE